MSDNEFQNVAKSRADVWWRALTRRGDPLHMPETGPTRAFEAGYLSAIEDMRAINETNWQQLRGGK